MSKILEMKNICKSFSGVKVLEDVCLSAKKGEIHAVVGSNGAGKSTLMKILCGLYKKDSGAIILDGEDVDFDSIRESKACGIEVVSQHIEFVEELSVAENLLMGKMPLKISGAINWKEACKTSKDILQRVELHFAPTEKIKNLSVGEVQMLGIASALFASPKIIVLDEPTPALSQHEIEILFGFVRKLKQQDVAIIYISHYLQEIFDLCDKVTILRDGKNVETREVSGLNKKEITKLMVGDYLSTVSELPVPSDEVVLSARNLTTLEKLNKISFNLKKGEIISLAGLTGSGRTEIARAISGLDKIESGMIMLNGKEVVIDSPKKAIDLGIVYMTEDRRGEGLIMPFSVKENVALPSIDKLKTGLGFYNERNAREITQKSVANLNIKLSGIEQLAENLSGGNQQKVVVGKLLELCPQILIMDEPTKAIDVGAKDEIYKLMRQLCEQGKSIILISSEMDEILSLSNRVFILRDGELVCEYKNEGLTINELLMAFEGGTDNEKHK